MTTNNRWPEQLILHLDTHLKLKQCSGHMWLNISSDHQETRPTANTRIFQVIRARITPHGAIMSNRNANSFKPRYSALSVSHLWCQFKQFKYHQIGDLKSQLLTWTRWALLLFERSGPNKETPARQLLVPIPCVHVCVSAVSESESLCGRTGWHWAWA